MFEQRFVKVPSVISDEGMKSTNHGMAQDVPLQNA